jgi:hypothetical protein
MHVWLDLIARELLFCALLTALGAGPAAFLPDRFGRGARWSLSPTLGLCAGVCVTVTVVYVFPAHDTGWMVIVLALASVALAWWRRPSRWRAPSLRSLVQVAIVAIVVIVSFDYPLAVRHTVGPVGFVVGDAGGYVSETDGEERESIHQAVRGRRPYADLALGAWSIYAQRAQQLDVSALEANVDDVLGLGSTDTQGPFLIAVLLVGALGAFAVVRIASGTPTWGAVLAGCLFAGPLFFELFMDGSQAAIAGSSLLGPMVVLGLEAVRRRQLATLVLLALLAAGLQTVYPLFVPTVVVGGGLALAVMVIRRVLRARPSRRESAIAAGQLAGVLALSAAFTPVAFARNARYWASIAHRSFSFVTLPHYLLPVDVLPGWTLQTREFYGLVNPFHQANPLEVLTAAAIPVLLIAVIAIGAMRYATVRVMLAMATGASLLAYYVWSTQNCSYCVQRNLIPIAALVPPALALGVVALAALRGRGGALLAALVVAVLAIAVGPEATIERQRLSDGGYLLDQQDRQAAAHLPSRPGRVELEGFTAGFEPSIELPLVYNLLNEKTHDEVSFPTVTDEGDALGYLIGGPQPLGPSFDPDYTYVLTRLAGIANQRRTIARYGPIALQRRTHALDVTIIGGVSAAPVRLDPTGAAWVRSALRLLVVGGRPGGRAWVSLVLRRTVPVAVRKGRGVSTVLEQGDTVRICLRALGTPPVRTARVKIAFRPRPAPVPRDVYVLNLPARGLQLMSMSVLPSSCTAR